jgi:hypothetical protein
MLPAPQNSHLLDKKLACQIKFCSFELPLHIAALSLRIVHKVRVTMALADASNEEGKRT